MTVSIERLMAATCSSRHVCMRVNELAVMGDSNKKLDCSPELCTFTCCAFDMQTDGKCSRCNVFLELVRYLLQPTPRSWFSRKLLPLL